MNKLAHKRLNQCNSRATTQALSASHRYINTWKATPGRWPLGPLARYVKLRVPHAPVMPGTFSPPPWVSDPDKHHGTCVTHVPWCMPGSLTSSFPWSLWRGKRSRHSRWMSNPQFYVSGKRRMWLVRPNQHATTCDFFIGILMVLNLFLFFREQNLSQLWSYGICRIFGAKPYYEPALF